MRSSLNHDHDGRVTYDTTDAMKSFWERRPRLLEPCPRSSIFDLLTFDKPSFNVSRLRPTQREGLIMWSKCIYSPFGQTSTQSLNLSCLFQAFNVFFFHNTLRSGQMFGPTDQHKPDRFPKNIYKDLLRTLSVSAPLIDAFAPPTLLPDSNRLVLRNTRLLYVIEPPPHLLLKIRPLHIQYTPRNLARTLSQLLLKMLQLR